MGKRFVVLFLYIVIGFEFRYLTPLFLFLPYLTWLLRRWKAAREFKEGRKVTKIPRRYFRVLTTI